MVNDATYEKIGLFAAREREELESIRQRIAAYLRRDAPNRPLSVAVFGAPGSGKSRLVNGVRDLLHEDQQKALAPLVEINLTQVTSVEDLGSALLRATEAAPLVPFVFFDEFDAPCQGATWAPALRNRLATWLRTVWIDDASASAISRFV